MRKREISRGSVAPSGSASPFSRLDAVSTFVSSCSQPRLSVTSQFVLLCRSYQRTFCLHPLTNQLLLAFRLPFSCLQGHSRSTSFSFYSLDPIPPTLSYPPLRYSAAITLLITLRGESRIHFEILVYEQFLLSRASLRSLVAVNLVTRIEIRLPILDYFVVARVSSRQSHYHCAELTQLISAHISLQALLD